MSAGKLLFHIMGGLWLAIVGYIIFGGSVFWAPTFNGHPDVTPAVFVPVMYSLVMLGVSVFLLLIYALMDVLAERRLQSRSASDLEPQALAMVSLTDSKSMDEREGLLTSNKGV